MKKPIIAAMTFLSVWMLTFSVRATDQAMCAADSRVEQKCRWVRGAVGANVRGVVLLDFGKGPIVVADGTSRDVFAILSPGALGHVGEFEFCQFHDRIDQVVVDADGTTVDNPQPWGCINAMKNVIADPDGERFCEYVPNYPTCDKTKSKR